MDLKNLPFNWFDIVVVVVLVAGILRGRKNGMSEELMPLLQWLLIIFGASQLYEPLGNWVSSMTLFSRLTCYVTCYIAVGVVIKLVFTGFKYLLHGKLIGSDIFGKGEYYLGMLAGMVRFGCALIAVLAVLNAKLFTQDEIKRDIEFQKDVYGSEFFPKLYNVQQQVFEKSLIGPLIKNNLRVLLITPTPSENKQIQRKEWQM